MAEPTVFDVWYQAAEIPHSEELTRQRHAAAEALGQGASPLQVLDLVRVSCGLVPLDEPFIHATQTTLQGDRPETVGEYELRLLCGSSLGLRLMAPAPAANSITASLALTIASFLELTPEPPQLFEIAATGRDALALARRNGRLPSTEVSPRRKQGEAAITDFATADSAVSAVYAEVSRLSREMKAFAEAAITNSQVRDEQLDILWWLFGERSFVLGSKISDLDAEIAAAASAIDLASLTRFLPGPVAARPYLDHVIGRGRVQSRVSGSLSFPERLIAGLPATGAITGFTPAIDYVRGAAPFGHSIGALAQEMYEELLLSRSVSA